MLGRVDVLATGENPQFLDHCATQAILRHHATHGDLQGTLGVLGQLGATANWHRIAREWLFGDPPSTELGVLEEPFHRR